MVIEPIGSPRYVAMELLYRASVMALKMALSSSAEILQIFRTSKISLNFSGSGQGLLSATNMSGRQIKARTFEVPCSGGFLLTEFAPKLDTYFAIDREIATFSSPEELVDKTRYFLSRPEERDNIAQAGHNRTVSEHTYARRFSAILDRLRSIEDRTNQAWTLSVDDLDLAVSRYRSRGSISWIRAALVALCTVAFGRQRASRAARRLVFELSWRLGGAVTYRASGLPGRLFYAES